MKPAEEIKNEIDILLAEVDQLPAMPALVQKIEMMAADPDIDVKLLATEISHDPSITAALIKLSNSAYYAPARAIRSVQEAIVTLGLDTVKSIIMVVASQKILKVDLDSFKLEAAEIWDHSLLVAELSAKIARHKQNGIPADVAFTAGLLHDLGKVVLSQHFRSVYQQILLEFQKKPHVEFTSIEKKFTGYTHAEIGARLLEAWHFPDSLIEAVRYQYNPQQASIQPGLCSMVHIANAIALSGGVGIDIAGLNQMVHQKALTNLGLSDQDLAHLYASLPELMDLMQDLRNF